MPVMFPRMVTVGLVYDYCVKESLGVLGSCDQGSEFHASCRDLWHRAQKHDSIFKQVLLPALGVTSCHIFAKFASLAGQVSPCFQVVCRRQLSSRVRTTLRWKLSSWVISHDPALMGSREFLALEWDGDGRWEVGT